MIGIIIPLVKSAAGLLLSDSTKSLATSKKTNDIVSKISNQFTGTIREKVRMEGVKIRSAEEKS